MLELTESFDRVVLIANRAETVASGMAELLHYLETGAGNLVSALRSIDTAEDVSDQLDELLRNEPPPKAVDTFYFGLFDAIDEHGLEQVGYYIAGVAGFDEDNPDSLCDPLWWPDGRYLTSRTLSTAKSAELVA